MTQRCTARSKQTGLPCKQPAVPGGMVCRYHGGRTPQARRKASERMAEQTARGLLATVQVEPVADPLALIAELAGEAVAFKAVMRAKVDELNSIRYSTEGGEQLRAEIAVYERAMDRAHKFVVEIVKLNLAERMTKVTENHASLIRDVMLAAMRDAGLEADKQTEVMSGVARHLRLIAS